MVAAIGIFPHYNIHLLLIQERNTNIAYRVFACDGYLLIRREPTNRYIPSIAVFRYHVSTEKGLARDSP